MIQDHDDDGRGLIVDDDPALDYILYEEMTKNEQELKGGRSGCFGVVVLLLFPVAGMMFFCWKC
jgi:hypothetical protein